MSADVPPGAYCTCGHQKRNHWGDGACLAAHRKPDGKEADATVCSCIRFEPKFKEGP